MYSPVKSPTEPYIGLSSLRNLMLWCCMLRTARRPWLMPTACFWLLLGSVGWLLASLLLPGWVRSSVRWTSMWQKLARGPARERRVLIMVREQANELDPPPQCVM